jgi:hypothetical protein
MKYIFRSFIYLAAIMLVACTGVGSLEPMLKNLNSHTPYLITSVELVDKRLDIVEIQNIDTPNSFFRGNNMAGALNSKLTTVLENKIKTVLEQESNPNGVEVTAFIGIKEARKTYFSYFWTEVEKVEVELELQALNRFGELVSTSEGACMMSTPVWNASAESINNKMISAFDCAVKNALYTLSVNSVGTQEQINE